MKRIPLLATIAVVACFLAAPHAGAAGDEHGHDHGDAAPAAGSALPRFAAESELFELVGVLDGRQITLYLDRAADNSPITEAQVELEIGGRKFKATRQGTDAFEIVLPDVPAPGVLQLTATVMSGADTDLLAGELDIHGPAPADEPAAVPPWKSTAAWASGSIAVLALLLYAGRRVLSSRAARFGGAA